MSLDFYLNVKEVGNVFDCNYTHNVVPMWKKSGVYDALYNSEGKKAKDIISILRDGIEEMESKPEEYKSLNPKNQWGSYDTALPWIREVLKNCEEYPEADVVVDK